MNSIKTDVDIIVFDGEKFIKYSTEKITQLLDSDKNTINESAILSQFENYLPYTQIVGCNYIYKDEYFIIENIKIVPTDYRKMKIAIMTKEL